MENAPKWMKSEIRGSGKDRESLAYEEEVKPAPWLILALPHPEIKNALVDFFESTEVAKETHGKKNVAWGEL